MKKNLFFGLIIIAVLAISVGAQGSIGSEDELKAKANELFEAQDYKEAKLMYAQLLSLYPKDPTYNYRFGACVLQTEADKSKPMKYLNFAASKANVDPLAYFYLGKAHHLNYEFAQAVKQYSKFKNKASSEDKTKYDVDRQIEMCKNGNSLLTKLNEVQVLERQSIAEKDFYRIYDESAIGGKLLVKPEEFKSKYDKKVGDKSIIFLANDANVVYYSSYGKKGDNGKDIYKAIKLGNGEWSEGVSLGTSINTKYDEDYAYIKPDGKTLYFASKGHTSMGGYDVFKSTLDDATGQWTEPENLDFAFNSADDDFMFVTDQAEITAYFASNRANEFGEVTVYKVLTDRAPAQLSVISGTFIAEGNPEQKKAKITVIDKLTQETIGVYETDDKGNYAIEIAKNGGEYQFNVETNEVDPIHTGVVSIPEQDEFEVLGQELRLVGAGDAQQLVIKNIFDGTATNNIATGGPSISSELIKMKANLEVNYNSSDLAALKKTETSAASDEEKITETVQVDEDESETTPIQDETTAEVISNEEKEPAINSVQTSDNSTMSVVAIESQLNELKAKKNSQIESKQNAIGMQYAAAFSLEQKATSGFKEANEMEAAGSQSVDVDLKRKEAGENALKASVAVQLAQELENSINEDLSNMGEIETSEMKINEAIGENNVQSASQLMRKLTSENEDNPNTEDIINESLSDIAERNSLANKKISDFSAKSQSFTEEKSSLASQLASVSAEADKANGKKKEELLKSKEATELDLKDIEYQFEALNKNLLDAKLMKKSLAIEKDEVLVASNRFSAGSSEFTEISEEQKNQLFDQLKKYRDENQLAYSPDNELYQSVDDVSIDEIAGESNNANTEDNQLTYSDETTNEDSNAFENEASDTSADEVSVNSIDNVNEVSESNDISTNNSDENVTGTTSKVSFKDQSLNSINSNYSAELGKVETVEDEELQLATKIQVYDNWIGDLTGKKKEVNNSYISEIDENERSILKKELDNLSASINEQQTAKNSAESELAQRASGQFVADKTPIVNSNDITETSVVKDEFTSLKFDQKLQATSAETATRLIEAKKALFEAGELSKQQQQAQESAYTLPTAAERTDAFAAANRLKKESEIKQVEAANKFAAFNLKEYQLNKAKIEKANELDVRYSTEGRDIAELLTEEANSFFTDAAILRSEVNETDRLSQKEVNLQKAYDYELLAIKKQKEALGKLGMVVSDVLSSKTNSTAPKTVKPFIQVIEDKEILAVVEAPKAKVAAEQKSAEVVTIDAKIEELELFADAMDEGEERDSVITILEGLDEDRERALKTAALYYERERQIKEGLVGVASTNKSPTAQVLAPTKPAFEIQLDSVDINSEREQLVLQSQNFKTFANNRQALVSQTKAAEVAYKEAIGLAEENERLQKQAIVESNMAKAVKDEGEKQRLIKSAQVIESQIKVNEDKIENLNKTIKVKNFLVQSLVEKDKSYLSSLSETEKQEYILLSADFVPEIKTPEAIAVLPQTTPEQPTANETVESDETAQDSPQLTPLDSENTLVLPNGVEVDETEDVLIEEPTSAIADTEDTIEEATETVAEVTTPKEVIREETVNPTPVNPTPKPNTQPTVEIENIDVVPREVKQAIFVTLNRNESAYNENKPIPTKASLPEGVVYKVQVGAFRNAIPASTFKGFAPLMAEPTGTGITRYTAGLFADENSATAARNEIRKIGYPDAFVVAFLNGERISISKARSEGGSTGSANSTTTFPKINSGSSRTTTNGTTVVASSAEVTQVTGGSKEALPAEFSSDNIEEVVNTKTVEGLYYTIQIGVFSSPIKKGIFDYEGMNVVQLPSGLYRYNAGMFESVLAAADLKNTISATIKDAFVTAYYNGERISLTEASKLKNQ